MKVLKINKKDYVLKFTTKALMNLNAKGITLTSLSEDMEKLNLISLYEAFYEGLKFSNANITLDEVYELIGKSRGFISKGGIVDDDRVTNLIINDIKQGKIKGITFDRVNDYEL